MINPFTFSYISEHSDAFTEMVSLGTLASKNTIDGIESEEEYGRGIKLQTILKARRKNLDLNEAQIEALDGCIGFFTFRNYTPSNRILVSVVNDNMTYENGSNMSFENKSIMTYND